MPTQNGLTASRLSYPGRKPTYPTSPNIRTAIPSQFHPSTLADPQQGASFRSVQSDFATPTTPRLLLSFAFHAYAEPGGRQQGMLPARLQNRLEAQEFTEYEGQMWTRAIGALVVSTPQSTKTVDTTGGDPGGTATLSGFAGHRAIGHKALVINDAGSPHDRIFAGENEDAPSERLREPIFAIIRECASRQSFVLYGDLRFVGEANLGGGGSTMRLEMTRAPPPGSSGGLALEDITGLNSRHHIKMSSDSHSESLQDEKASSTKKLDDSSRLAELSAYWECLGCGNFNSMAILSGFAGDPTVQSEASRNGGSPHDRVLAGENEDALSERPKANWGRFDYAPGNDPRPPPGWSGGLAVEDITGLNSRDHIKMSSDSHSESASRMREQDQRKSLMIRPGSRNCLSTGSAWGASGVDPTGGRIRVDTTGGNLDDSLGLRAAPPYDRTQSIRQAARMIHILAGEDENAPSEHPREPIFAIMRECASRQSFVLGGD
ncbi:hypothetical protein B0H11DRAFT_2243909 [Mycena galericulata]|nr:hypothetical protein B0H11DRAFT_2243909 [Mycena galericulata]